MTSQLPKKSARASRFINKRDDDDGRTDECAVSPSSPSNGPSTLTDTVDRTLRPLLPEAPRETLRRHVSAGGGCGVLVRILKLQELLLPLPERVSPRPIHVLDCNVLTDVRGQIDVLSPHFHRHRRQTDRELFAVTAAAALLLPPPLFPFLAAGRKRSQCCLLRDNS